jgi:hypothetical protein
VSTGPDYFASVTFLSAARTQRFAFRNWFERSNCDRVTFTRERPIRRLPSFGACAQFAHGLAGGAFGNLNVYEAPNTIVRPCGRALAEYSGSYLKTNARLFAGRMKLVWKPTACTE